MKKVVIWISFVVITSVLLAACSGKTTTTPVPTSTTVDLIVAEGHVIPNKDLKLSFPARGKIGEIFVIEGQRVKKGDVLVRQGDSEQAKATFAAAKLELLQAQQVYDEFLRNVNLDSAQAFANYQVMQVERSQAQLDWEAIDPNKVKDDIDSGQADVQDKKKLLDDANDTLKKYLDLKSDNPTRRSAEEDVRKAEADYNSAQRKVEELQRSIDTPRAKLDAAQAAEAEAHRLFENMLGNTPDPDKKAILDARLENAKAQALAAENVLSNYDLKAPFVGVVTDVNVTQGELIGSDKYAIQLADVSKWYIETSDLTELEVANVFVGQDVVIAPDSMSSLVLKGTVESISDSFKLQGGDILYTVKIKLNDFNPNLRWGMTVQVTFTPLIK